MNKKQSGFSHMMIIVVVLAVVLIGALGFIFWQNFIQNKSDNAKKEDTSKVSTKQSETTTTNNTANITDKNKGYLVLSDWGVRFKLPSDLGSRQITYYKGVPGYTDSGKYVTGDGYSFSTNDVEALGENCAYNASDYWMPLASVTRYTSPYNQGSAVEGPTLIKKLGNYYYYTRGPQALCSVNGSSTVQTKGRAAVDALVPSIELVQ
jgi:cytoskeletal protein RodZ